MSFMEDTDMASYSSYFKNSTLIEADKIKEDSNNNVSIKSSANVILDSNNTIILGNLIVLGEIQRGYKFKLDVKEKRICMTYFSDQYKLKNGKHYFEADDGIIVIESQIRRFKDLIAEALI